MVAAGKRTSVSRPASAGESSCNAARPLAACAVNALADGKAEDIAVMDMRALPGAVADYFVLATGGSDRQLRALARSVDEHVEETMGERPWHREGLEHLQWVLLDYVNVVVHLFSEEKRAYYDLERLWGDASIERVPDGGDAADVSLLHE